MYRVSLITLLATTLASAAGLRAQGNTSSAFDSNQWNANLSLTDSAAHRRAFGSHVDSLDERTLPNMREDILAESPRNRTLRRTAWRIIALLSTTTRENEDHRAQWKLCRWLARKQTTRGVFAVSAQPQPDASRQLVATVAITLANNHTSHPRMLRECLRATDATLRCFENRDAAVSATDTAMLVVLADSLAEMHQTERSSRLRTLAKAAAATLPAGEHRRTDAIRQLVALRTQTAEDAPISDDLTIAMCVPGDPARHPMQTWVAAYALRV